MTSYDKRRNNYHDGGRHGEDKSKSDIPPNSRLFIVCGKNITETEFRNAFQCFGTIEEVWVLKDRGIAYIKFAKTSEAALAMETMNGRCIDPHPRPLKVMIANSRSQGSNRDITEAERTRLFLVVPKSMNEDELRSHFVRFGDVDYVSIVKDRNTNESKGLAYVKYHRMSHAALAFEDCDRSFKPVFAEPKPSKGSHESNSTSGGGGGGTGSGNTGPGSTVSGSTVSAYDILSYVDPSTNNPDGFCSLVVIASGSLSQDQIYKLFDIVPGLDYCEKKAQGSRQSPLATFVAVYNNPQSAAYAKEKLSGFEYPPGQRLTVKYDSQADPGSRRPLANSPSNQSQPISSQTNLDLAQLSETIANATALLQAAGYTPGGTVPPTRANPTGTAGTAVPSGETYDPSYCSVKLPSPQPLSSIDSQVAERLFVVCTPVPPPMYALKDVFGRFGGLIDIYMLSGKTCGYAKYSNKSSADKAVATLHGQEVCGSRLKVMTADPQDKNIDGRKRQKFDS